jgi:hypothetical protein
MFLNCSQLQGLSVRGLLLGDIPLPARHAVPARFTTGRMLEVARGWVQDNRALWQRHPAAVAWARKCFNSVGAFLHLVHNVESPLMRHLVGGEGFNPERTDEPATVGPTVFAGRLADPSTRMAGLEFFRLCLHDRGPGLRVWMDEATGQWERECSGRPSATFDPSRLGSLPNARPGPLGAFARP